ncbi:glycosyltransferase family 4 protein [Candidatus Roizmanbacteria bacterium]|nr:glycosyltransferase family 4 protein [Candidatus Roizmanbacteria bacterium]
MKKIGIDARLYLQTGVGVYLRNLLHYLPKYSDSSVTYYIYIGNDDKKSLPTMNDQFIVRSVSSRWHSFSEQTSFLKALTRDSLDLMHFTYFSYPILYRKKFIATVHDLTPLLFRTGKASTQLPFLYALKHIVFRLVLSQQIANASHLITPTAAVKNQIRQIFGQSATEKTSVIYEGVNYELQQVPENILLAEKIDKPFFLYVGNFYPHKNVETLLQAFSHIQKDVDLLLVGPKDYFSQRIVHMIHQLGQSHRITFFHDVSLEKLVFFYKHALALVHPSYSEGFGLPIIEAAFYGCPIIASNIEVFGELLGEKYLAFDPHRETDIFNKLNYFLEKKPTYDYQSVIEKYSFEVATQKTVSLYEKLLNDAHSYSL